MNVQTIHQHKVSDSSFSAFQTLRGSCSECGKTVECFWIDEESDRYGRWSKWK